MSNVLNNASKYQEMVDALNAFYWDNGIEPHMTAALLDKFAGEVSRLAQFIRSNGTDLDRDAELPLERKSGDGANWICAQCDHENFYLRPSCWFCDAPAPS